MRHRQKSIIAGALSAALVLFGLTIPSAGASEPEVLYQETLDFADGAWAPWAAESGATLAAATDGDNPVLAITRTNDWEGARLQTPFFADYAPGDVINVSAKVKLAEPLAEAVTARFVAIPGYVWQGNTAITADDWTTITGTYTITAANQDEFAITLVSADYTVESAKQTYTILVDDLSAEVVRPAPVTVEPVTVLDITTDFEDLTTGPWGANGSANPQVSADEGGNHYASWSRSNDWSGIALPSNFFADLQAGDSLSVTGDVRLADGTPDQEARFVLAPQYQWGTNAVISADQWTSLTGSWTLTEADLAENMLFLGSADYQVDDVNQPYTVLVDNLRVTVTRIPADAPDNPGGLNVDFEGEEDYLGPWGPRDDGKGTATLSQVTEGAPQGDGALLISERGNQGHGIIADATGLLLPGVEYEISFWARFGEGQEVDDLWLSGDVVNGESNTYPTLAEIPGVSNSEWTKVTASFALPNHDTAGIYLQTKWYSDSDGNTSDLYIDDIQISRVVSPPIQLDVPNLKDSITVPFGVAVSMRDIAGDSRTLVAKHFNQVTAENDMKPEAWYDGPDNFAPSPNIAEIMDFAVENDANVYGHVLVWHSQTPDWFFQDVDGNPLTTSEEDKQFLRDRMRTHIFNVAEYLSQWGEFGADNPLNAFDVVNEVVDDGAANADGLRRSEWYRILGEEYIHLAFEYAEEAFNELYAAEDVERPIALFINDYNTEQSGKMDRYYALVERMIAADTPIDGVGHQFHTNVANPVPLLEAAIVHFKDLGLVQAVTEMDVTTGVPVTAAKLTEQAYYYRDAFRVFRDHIDDLFSVTVWGLVDGRSWYSDRGDPLLFNDHLQVKPAFWGVLDAELPTQIRSADVFGAAGADLSADSAVWEQLPLQRIGAQGGFLTRWTADGVEVYVRVLDGAANEGDQITVLLPGDQSVTVPRSDASVTEIPGGYQAVISLQASDLGLSTLADGGRFNLNVQITDGATAITSSWNEPPTLGELTLRENLSFLQVAQTSAAPVIDGAVDEVWARSAAVQTLKAVSGSGGGVATVQTLWHGDKFFVLMDVADAAVDVTGSSPWEQDSVEIYVDAGNAKNGSYRAEDMQLRINADNELSFGAGDVAAQEARINSAVVRTDTGYRVEVEIDMLGLGGLNTIHGMDFQVNDAVNGARFAISNWADPSNAGYQSTARWGVGKFVSGTTAPEQPGPKDPDPVNPVTPKPNSKFAQIVPTPDLSGDGIADVLAVDHDGVLWLYRGKGNGGLSVASKVGAGWGDLTISAPGDFNSDGRADILGKAANGDLFFYAGNGKGGFAKAVKAGWGWGPYDIIPAGDVTGDGIPDVLAIDAKGVLYYYAGNGKGGFTGKLTRNGQGWVNVDLYPAGDLNGDGNADILSIRADGSLHTHLGRGDGGFSKSTQTGRGWAGYELFAGSDANGDGLADLYSRDSKNRLWFYAGKPGGFRTATQVGSGW